MLDSSRLHKASNFIKEVCVIKQGQQLRASAKFIHKKADVLVALLYYRGLVIFRLKWKNVAQ